MSDRFERGIRLPTARLWHFAICAAAVVLWPAASGAQVQMTINATQSVKSISPYIYGTNDSQLVPNATSVRLGGNRWTAYNWENNDSNAGKDYYFQNDGLLSSSTTPGAAVLPALQASGARGAATLLTIPMAGYVSKDRNGGGDVRYNNNTYNPSNNGWINGTPNPNYLQERFVPVVASKPGAFSLTPDTGDSAVYQDEFVNWVNQTAPGQKVFYDLDNEPDLWSDTHAEVHPANATYQEMVNSSLSYARAIKVVSPSAMVFGAVNYGWNGYTQLQHGPQDPNITDTILNFQASYLKQIKVADQEAGSRSVDVLDMHWYPEAHGTNGIRITDNDTSAATVAARVQAARSLWDPTYQYSTNPATGENSWITHDSLPYQPQATPAQFKTTAIQLLPREQALINEYYPGTKIGITEYQYGAGNHISGGLAEADALGAFGQQGVFAANWWSDGARTNNLPDDRFVASAFNMYLNYDGRGSKFGNTSILAATNSNSTTAVYASVDAGNSNRMVIVLINRNSAAQGSVTATLNLSNIGQLSLADAYQLGNGTNNPTSAAISHVILNSSNLQWLSANSLSYTMLPSTATTLVLVKAQLGDFNLDGRVTNSDLQSMLAALKNVSGYQSGHNLSADNLLALGDFNDDHVFNAGDILPMQTFLTAVSGGGGSTAPVPEPAGLVLIIVAGSALWGFRSRIK